MILRDASMKRIAYGPYRQEIREKNEERARVKQERAEAAAKAAAEAETERRVAETLNPADFRLDSGGHLPLPLRQRHELHGARHVCARLVCRDGQGDAGAQAQPQHARRQARRVLAGSSRVWHI